MLKYHSEEILSKLMFDIQVWQMLILKVGFHLDQTEFRGMCSSWGGRGENSDILLDIERSVAKGLQIAPCKISPEHLQ